MQDAKALYSPHEIPPGMFSSPQILECLKADQLVEGWDKNCIMPATYEMRLGTFACWYTGGLRAELGLGPEEDANKGIHTSLAFQPNSLTFISTLEAFRLPCDIIARFNLLGRWVRKGLLLGTAPIVEPEFCGRLLIPIHNFSSYPVQIDFADRIIAVEFTKTLPLNSFYVSNLESRGNIKNFVDQTGVVESSVSSALAKNQNLFNDIQAKTKIFSIAGAITLFLLICSVMTLVINIFNVAENARKSASQADSVIKTYAAKNDSQFAKFREEIRELEFTVQKLREELAKK